LLLCKEFPILKKCVEAKISDFIRSVEQRTKGVVPNLGEFICLLSWSDKYSWKDVNREVCGEAMARFMKWAKDAFPELKGVLPNNIGRKGWAQDLVKGLSKPVAELVLRGVFQSSVVGRRLIMFNVWFINNMIPKKSAMQLEFLNKQSRTEQEEKRTDKMLRGYERTCGIPSNWLISKLQDAVKRIFNDVVTWNQYYEEINMPSLDKNQIALEIFEANCLSFQNGYHIEFFDNKGKGKGKGFRQRR